MLLQNIDYESGLNGHFYGNNKNEKSVLYVPGFPKYPQNTKKIDYFVNKGFNVLVPMFYGTHESDGEFDIESTIESVKLSYEYLIAGNIANILTGESFNIQNNSIDFFGLSYGALALGLFMNKYKLSGEVDTKFAIFVSSLWAMESFSDNTDFIDGTDKTFELMNKIYPKSYRFKDIKQFFDIIKGKEDIDYGDYSLNKDTARHSIHGILDKLTPSDMSVDYNSNYPYNSELHLLKGGHSSKIDKEEYNLTMDKIVN